VSEHGNELLAQFGGLALGGETFLQLRPRLNQFAIARQSG
jgi:hypothetical protein